MGGSKCLVWLVVVLALTMSLAEAQSGTTASCAQDLIPCGEYLNSNSTPPSSCCDPLKRTVENELPCLCNLFYNSNLLQGLNITVESALALSRSCGVTSDLSSCNGAPAPGSRAPPATPGGSTPPSGAAKVTFTGISFLLLFWVSMLFN
ncbi:lipid transfer-like protein VAS [Vigna unguiculata]|uniref:lipid transfer-like protein VAS n=1 Tax=Vigna unguiculata TaxID=3917 RepID=UPI00101608C6|nr:lipid transfer-like protein VAS [Vigna unguiculata]